MFHEYVHRFVPTLPMFQVYWSNGAQIIPPHDAGIARGIDVSLKPWSTYGDVSTPEALIDIFGKGKCADGRPLVEDFTDTLGNSYFTELQSKLCAHPKENAASTLKVVYTAMHGIGAPWFKRGFAAFGLPPPISVTEQEAPDPSFPTVAVISSRLHATFALAHSLIPSRVSALVQFPNPEEGAGALKLAMAVADANGAQLVLANDPDADRLAVAEKSANGSWVVLTGDQIGVLLADWELTKYQSRPADSRKPAAMLSTAVSSRMIATLAANAGCYWEETLTGFKWLCSRAAELRREGYDVLLCYEEAIGFCVGDVVNDKDGVSAGAVFAEMACYLKRERSSSVLEHLQHLYATHGAYTQNNSYVICRNPETTAAIFHRLRADGKYWLRLGELRIEWVRDLTTGVDTDRPDGRATLPLSSSSHMITYRFSNGATVTLRGSGTEPKIKWYAESRGSMAATTRAAIATELEVIVKLIIEEMLQPQQNHLEMRA